MIATVRPRLRLERLPSGSLDHLVGVSLNAVWLLERVLAEGKPVWAFLDYGPGDPLSRFRWLIVCRPERESFEIVSPWVGAPTNERALDNLAAEARLAKRAIGRIRKEALRADNPRLIVDPKWKTAHHTRRQNSGRGH
mgnify:CR=1 FL=1